MISPARSLCYKLLHKIDSRKVFSDDALNSDAMQRLEVRDRHLTTEIVYGTLRWQGTLDYMLSSICSRSWKDVDPGARILLRMSLYQMWQMDRIPEYALVHDAVELAKKNLGKGIDGFINGILRRLTRSHPWKKVEFLKNAPPWIRASLPEWLWQRWAMRYGEACAMDFSLSLNSQPQTAIKFFADSSQKTGSLPGWRKSDLVPGALIREAGSDATLPEASDKGGFQCQDEASQLIPHLLPIHPGNRIWDACAAPGGKSAILAQRCGASGRVVASDLKEERTRKLRQFLLTAGAGNADVLVADASKLSPFTHGFDAVLVDVPCSGLGTLRRNPEIKWNFEPAEFAVLQKAQKKILHQLADSVRIGGCLLYSTCSTEPEENEQVVRSFLDAHPGFYLTRPDSPDGIDRWTGKDEMVRTFPGLHPWDGFFAALITRRS